jgi:hypothetical protein
MGKFFLLKGASSVPKVAVKRGVLLVKRIHVFAAIAVLFAVTLTTCNVLFHELAVSDHPSGYLSVEFIADNADGNYPQTRTVRAGDFIGPMPEPWPEKEEIFFWCGGLMRGKVFPANCG